MKLQLKRSNVLESGAAKEPTASQLEYGELAINYNTDDPAIFLKDSSNNVIRISGVGNIADDGQVELPASTTPPLNPEAGNLWYNSDDGRLYIYYSDGDSAQWVDASPDSWDPSSYPDVSDDTAQSNTLDDRYLMLNSANDPITGGLNITGGNVGIGTSSPSANLHVATTGEAKLIVEGDSDNDPGEEGSSLELRTDAGAIRHQIQGGGTSKNLEIVAGSSGTTTAGNDCEIAFHTKASASSSTERMRIDADGNVGIGTTSPEKALHVKDSFGNTGIFESTSDACTIQLRNSTGESYVGSNNGDNFYVSINGKKRLYVTSGGKVGIGTDSPNGILEIAGNSTAQTIKYGNGTTTGYFTSKTDVDRPAANTLIHSHIYQWSGNTVAQTNALTGDDTVNKDNGYLTFETNNGAGLSERMRITSNGNVGIGTNSPGAKLDVNGSLSKNSGSFKIDHPLPTLTETHHLVHSFVEAPDASNLYAGMVDLFGGAATVNIDTAHGMTEGTFEALNTVQSWSSSNESGYAPVKSSLSGNLLTIECQDTTSNDTVYYEVRGIRKDQHMIETDWTDENGRVITEPLKQQKCDFNTIEVSKESRNGSD